MNDLHVVNTIKENEIELDDISETIHFEDDDLEDEEDFDESELIISIKDPKSDTRFDDDFEIEIPTEKENLKKRKKMMFLQK